MKKVSLILIGWMLFCTVAIAQSELKYTISLHSGGMYLKSEHTTSAGFGPGLGFNIGLSRHIVVQSDVNIYWINGTSGSVRLAVGYKRAGIWSPALYTNITTIFGDRTVILYEDGSRPANPSFVIGVKFSPFRWENDQGYVSALEFGYGIGKYNARYLEMSFLSLGFKIK